MTTLWLVIQEGGSSGEHYPSFYDKKNEALSDARGHRKATYRSTDPIPVPAELRGGQVCIAESDLVELIERVREAEYR